MPAKTSYAPGEPVWADLASPDTDASRAFYGALFGWEAADGNAEFGGYANFSLGGAKVAGLLPLMAEGQPPAWTVYLSTDDADATTEAVTAAGGTTVAPPMDVGDLGRMAVFTDPTGAFFGVWQAGQHTGSQLVQEEGAPTWADVTTRDTGAAGRFYAAVFGWDVRAGEGYTEFARGEDTVAGMMAMPEHMPEQVPPFWMPYFAAADPGATADRAAGLGGTVLVPAQDFPGGTFAVVQDPQGATFGLLRTT